MQKFHITAIGMVALIIVGQPGIAADQTVTFDKTFLTDYSRLVPRQAPNGGTDFAFIPPQAVEAAAKYKGIMADQPEILISPNSDYKGASPANLELVANSMRSALTSRLEAGGYNVVDKPGPGVLYIRVALTDLELKKRNAISSSTHSSAQSRSSAWMP